ncbi:MAG: hypothetical protein ACK5ZJ_02100 [Acidobacteriota bacterium]
MIALLFWVIFTSSVWAQRPIDPLIVDTLQCCETAPYSFNSAKRLMDTFIKKYPARSYYLKVYPKPSKSAPGFAESTHPPVGICVSLFRQIQNHDETIFLKTRFGSAYYIWSGKTKKGTWKVYGTQNPFVSYDGNLLLVHVEEFRNKFTFNVLRKPTLELNEMKKELLEFMATFPIEEATVVIKTDPWHWLSGGCGDSDAQAWEWSPDITEDQVSDTAISCTVKPRDWFVQCSNWKTRIR